MPAKYDNSKPCAPLSLPKPTPPQPYAMQEPRQGLDDKEMDVLVHSIFAGRWYSGRVEANADGTLLVVHEAHKQEYWPSALPLTVVGVASQEASTLNSRVTSAPMEDLEIPAHIEHYFSSCVPQGSCWRVRKAGRLLFSPFPALQVANALLPQPAMESTSLPPLWTTSRV